MTNGLGLGYAYGATLDRMKKQGEDKARLRISALMWISHTERPLKTDELCHALAVEIGSPNLNTANVPSVGTLLACCQGLVVKKEVSTETCITYLNSQPVKAFSTSPSPAL